MSKGGDGAGWKNCRQHPKADFHNPRFRQEKKCLQRGKLLNKKTDLTSLDTKTRWSSTFEMIRDDFKLRIVFENTIKELPELEALQVSSTDWKTVKSVGGFLEDPAKECEKQSSSTYVTVGQTVGNYNRMEKICHLPRLTGDPTLQTIFPEFL